MYRKRDVWRILPFAVLLGLWSCSETPTDEGFPDGSGEFAPSFFATPPAPGFHAHAWIEPREGSRTLTRNIGSDGGVIDFGELGARIVFPRGALSETLTVEARAVPGSVVAFEFGPHGVEFDVPVQIRIRAGLLAPGWSGEGTGWEDLAPHARSVARRQLSKLVGVYYMGSGKGVTPVETLPMYLEGDEVVLEVRHFCGYAVASG